jgi:CRISPR-associated endonuclease/helicase Cas3
LLARLVAVAGLGEAEVFRWIFLALALHDVGKFAPTFQAKQMQLFVGLFGTEGWRGTETSHDQDGRVLWDTHLKKRGDVLGTFAAPGAGRPHHRREAVSVWAESAICHHGRPREIKREHLLGDRFQADHLATVDEFVAAILGLAQEIGRAADAPPIDQRVTSWLVAGIAVLADWIGSNQAWFPYRGPGDFPDLVTYWHDWARSRAAQALGEAGIIAAAPSISIRLCDLLPEDAVMPSPLQSAVCDVLVGEGPQLFVIEDQTGSGKTEAALALAGRLIAAGRAEGLFVALPTMATANAMYARYAGREPPLYKRLFAAGAEPSIVLAHSRRDLALRGIGLTGRAEEGDYDSETETASTACARWLGDDRRKAALADCGVGTVDQAVLAVMSSRYQSLRLAGLARKVLIVDEIHAHEAYLRELVCGLLRFHAAFGGSAILLSATLPAGQRQRFAAAFAEGAGLPTPELARPNDAYPLLTRLGQEGADARPVTFRPGLERQVRIVTVRDVSQAAETVVAASRAGQAVCWIRNTVADALEAYLLVRGEVPAILFHARFAMGDRLAREHDVLTLFGKRSKPEDRAGQVLIATQVVEQSLDLDFDAMVTDLAPIDALVQRAGRLWRHNRPGRGGHPTLHVLTPAPDADAKADWYRRLLPRAAMVYPNHAALWLTTRELARRQVLRFPEDARAVIEAVYGNGVEIEAPSALFDSWLKTEGKDHGAVAIARSALLPLAEGYPGAVGAWHDDVRMPTRLGEPQAQLRLARWDGVTLRPWCGGNGWLAWRLSEVTVLRRWVAAEYQSDDPALVKAMVDARAGWPERYDDSILVPLVQAGNNGVEWEGRARDGNDGAVTLVYSQDAGLRIRRPG